MNRQTFLVALGLLLAGPAFGAETTANQPVPRLTLADVVRLAGEGNPRLAAARETVAASRAERRIAGAYPNPKLAVDHLQPGNGERTIFTGDRQEQFGIEIPLLIPGQRPSRIARANADVIAAEARVASETNLLMGEALLSFWRLLGLQETGAILSNDFVEVSRIKEIVAGRREQGAASDYDVTRVEVELGVLGSGLEGARADVAAEASQLASRLGLTNGLPIADGPLQPWEVSTNLLHDYEVNPYNTPQVIAAARESAAAEKGITVAKRSRWPELSLSAGHTWTRHPYGAADSVGLNLEIPIFDNRRGILDKAISEARAAEARYQTAVAEVAGALRQLAESVRRRQAALERHRNDLEPRLARLQQMSADAYALGRHSLLELLDAQQARREVRLHRIETLNALNEAQIRFLAATGRLAPYLPPAPANPSTPPSAPK